MKKISMFCAIALLCVSCSKDLYGIDDVVTSKNQTRTMTDLEIIETLGLSTEGIEEDDDYYVVEGDIIIRKDSIESYMPELQTRQAYVDVRWVKRSRVKYIRVSTVGLQGGGWEPALLNAISAWNAVPNCDVRFSHVGNWAGHVFVQTGTSLRGSSTVADANIPQSGRPGNIVRVNPDFNYLSTNAKTSVMVHELGHTIGLAHTNMLNNSVTAYHLWGTPHGENNEDRYSVMNQGSFDRPWGYPRPGGGTYGFTNGDILAIQRMYGSPDYSIGIVGPKTLAVGQTATYELTCAPLLQGYMSDFVTTWTTDERIVDQTNTSITIRCNHARVHPISITANTNYNGIPMGATYDINTGYISFANRTITDNTTVISDCAIEASDFIVPNNAPAVNLTLQAPVIYIDSSFTVNSLGSFYMSND